MSGDSESDIFLLVEVFWDEGVTCGAEEISLDKFSTGWRGV
jgi:hypothetical protein